MQPKRPYFLRACYDWCIENNYTPYLVVNTSYEDIKVPEEYISNGQIVFNISPIAANNLTINNLYISFDATFGGIPQEVFIPMVAVVSLYGKEASDGIACEYEEYYDTQFFEDYAASFKPHQNSSKHLKLVK